MVKKVFLILTLILLVALTVRCLSSFSFTKKDTLTADPENEVVEQKITLSMWHYFDNKSQRDMIEWLVEGFNTSNSQCEIVADYIPIDNYKKQLQIGFAAGKLPDIVIIDSSDLPAFANMGMFADITDDLADWKDKDQYLEEAWKSVTLDGKTYGIPFVSNCLALYYNEDMLSAAGVEPPTTWEELKSTAKILTTNGVTGFGMSGVNYENGTFQFFPFIYSAGATYENLNSPEGINAFTLISDLVKDGSMSIEVANWSQSDVNNNFMAEKIAMQINGPWQIPNLRNQVPNLNWGVTMIPADEVYASVLGGEAVAVVNNDKAQFSVDFIKYLGKPEIINIYAAMYGSFPSRKDLITDPFWTDDPIQKVFLDALQVAKARGPSPYWPEISSAISASFQNVITGEATPEEAALAAQEKIDKILQP